MLHAIGLQVTAPRFLLHRIIMTMTPSDDTFKHPRSRWSRRQPDLQIRTIHVVILIIIALVMIGAATGYHVAPLVGTNKKTDRRTLYPDQEQLIPRWDRPRHLVGVIGGIGPAADLRFQELVLEKDRRRRKEKQFCFGETSGFLADADYSPYLLYHNPQIPNNNLAVLNQGPTSLYALVDSARALRSAGVTEVAFCCTTAYHWKDAVEECADIPVLDLLDEVALQAMHRGYTRVGLLDVDGTIRSGVFQQALERRGIEVVFPDKNDQQEIMKAVAALKSDGFIDNTMPVEQLQQVARRLVANNNLPAIILGCTEIAMALDKSAKDWDVDVIDSLDVLAEYIVHHDKIMVLDDLPVTSVAP